MRGVLPDGTRGDVLQRSIRWSMPFARLLFRQEDLRERFPHDAKFILMPEEDEELLERDPGGRLVV